MKLSQMNHFYQQVEVGELDAETDRKVFVY